jgi:flagellin
MNAHRQLGVNQTSASKNMEKLSSGLRINRAGDDAAGLAISEKMRGQIRGLKQAMRNAQDGISLIQTAEGALNETHAILQRMRELAAQSANDTNTDADRNEIQKEIDQLAKELTRIANDTEFNTQKLINGGIKAENLGELGFHIGANEGQRVFLSIEAMDAKTLQVSRDVEVVGAQLEADAVQVTGVELGASPGAALEVGASISVTAQLVPGDSATRAAKTAPNAVDLEADYTGEIGDFVLNGQTIALTNTLGALRGSGESPTEPPTIGQIAAALQTDINAVFDGDDHDGVQFTVSHDSDSGVLTITSSVEGASSKVDLTGSGAVAGMLGFTDLDAVYGTDAGADTVTITFADNKGNRVDVTGVATDATEVTGTGAFAGLKLTVKGPLNGSLSATINIQMEMEVSRSATFADGKVDEEAYAAAGIDVSSRDAANSALTTIQAAIDKVSAERSKLGAYQNRLEHTISNLGTSAENLQAAESRIRDLDMAEEIMAFTKNNILQQAATAMLAQANMAPQSVLQLLG